MVFAHHWIVDFWRCSPQRSGLDSISTRYDGFVLIYLPGIRGLQHRRDVDLCASCYEAWRSTIRFGKLREQKLGNLPGEKAKICTMGRDQLEAEVRITREKLKATLTVIHGLEKRLAKLEQEKIECPTSIKLTCLRFVLYPPPPGDPLLTGCTLT